MQNTNSNKWYLERVLNLLAGSFVITSISLAQYLQNPWYLILAALVGINLVIYALTGFCLMAILLTKLGLKPRSAA